MSKYINLNIKIDLEGDIKETISKYNYSNNSDPKSKYTNIYIPYRTLIGNTDTFKTSFYSKDPKQNFLTIERMKDLLHNRSSILKNVSTKINIELKKLNDSISKTSDILEKKQFQDKKDEIIKYIDKSNIDIILPLFFKKKSYFYYKNNKYIINDFTITDYDFNYNDYNEKLLSYNDFIKQLMEEKQEELYQYELLRPKNNNINEQDKKLLKESLNTKALNEVINNKNIENIVKTRAEIIVNKYNKKAKQKNKNIEYIYINKIGIQVKSTLSSSKNITIKLNVINFKTKHISNLKSNCKDRKKELYFIIKELFGILDDEKEYIKKNEMVGYKKFYNDNYDKFLNKIKNKQDIFLTIYNNWNKLSDKEKIKYIKDALKKVSLENNLYNDEDSSEDISEDSYDDSSDDGDDIKIYGYKKYYQKNYNKFFKKEKNHKKTVNAINISWNNLSNDEQNIYLKDQKKITKKNNNISNNKTIKNKQSVKLDINNLKDALKENRFIN